MKRMTLRGWLLTVGVAVAWGGSIACSSSATGETSTGTGGTFASSTGGANTGDASLLACGTSKASGGELAADDAGSSNPDCVIHVAKAGSDTNSGSNWAEAFETVQEALDTSSALIRQAICSTVEVWVANGTYRPISLADSTDTRSATFQLVPNAALYGGFAARESLRAERNVAANVTILSGDIGVPDDASDNSYHVVTGVTGATLDGFTITGGNANGATRVNGRCGGMYNYDSCYPSSQGGGMYNYKESSPTVTNCTFTGNSAAGSGGGMYNLRSSPTVTHCTFADNGAGDGGGMSNLESAPEIKNCAFTHNNADVGGGMDMGGSSPEITNCTFTENGAESGGGMDITDSSPNVVNCTFMGNSAVKSGGGISSNTAYSGLFNNCTFTRNSAGDSGGALWSAGTFPIAVTNSILWGDKAGTSVSEIFNRDPESLVSVRYSIVQGWNPDTTIIADDPLFVDAANGDLRLKENSPAIDAGNGCAKYVTLTDQAGNSRVDITGVTNAVNGLDIGAFEYQGKAGTYTCISAFDCS
jgi:predicted outer membrane repeat protein